MQRRNGNGSKNSLLGRLKKLFNIGSEKEIKKTVAKQSTESSSKKSKPKKETIFSKVRIYTKKIITRRTQKTKTKKVENKKTVKVDTKTKLKSGVKVNTEKYNELINKIDDINKMYQERKQHIKEQAVEKLDPRVAKAIIKEIEEIDNNVRTRFTTRDFDDLRDIDVNRILDSIENDEDLQKRIDDFANKDYYDITKRDEMYRENYIKAIITEWSGGDLKYASDEVLRLIEIIEQIDIDEFMLFYYNKYSNTQIKDIYDRTQKYDYIDSLIKVYERVL